jgi:hypothetical protein
VYFIFVMGTRFFTWGSEPDRQTMRCSQCGAAGVFTNKKGMRFVTLFFVIPVLPISGVKHLRQCPNCRARYEAGPR